MSAYNNRISGQTIFIRGDEKNELWVNFTEGFPCYPLCEDLYKIKMKDNHTEHNASFRTVGFPLIRRMCLAKC